MPLGLLIRGKQDATRFGHGSTADNGGNRLLCSSMVNHHDLCAEADSKHDDAHDLSSPSGPPSPPQPTAPPFHPF